MIVSECSLRGLEKFGAEEKAATLAIFYDFHEEDNATSLSVMLFSANCGEWTAGITNMKWRH